MNIARFVKGFGKIFHLARLTFPAFLCFGFYLPSSPGGSLAAPTIFIARRGGAWYPIPVERIKQRRDDHVPYQGRTSEIDLLMIHEKGIFVFESKNYSGWIFGSADQLHWTQSLQNGKPLWGQDCTHCMACICCCPAEAIEYGKMSLGKPRYHFEAL